MYSNAEILAAVVTKWAMPLATELVSGNLGSVPFISSLQTKIISSGWVGNGWSMAKELAPFAEPVVRSIVTPILVRYLQNVPDEAIPQMAHGIVDAAIANGELVVLDGKIRFDMADLQGLKRLLNANLRVADCLTTYNVKEEE